MVGTAVASSRFRLRRGAHPDAVIDPTDEQRRVIEHRGGRLRVLAGPGTGKTATLVESVTREMRPGMTAVIVEADERSTRPVDDIVALGKGHVYRQEE